MSRFEFFLIIMTKIEKFIGIAKATKFPNKEPVEIESPIIIVMPVIANNIEIKAIKDTFSFK